MANQLYDYMSNQGLQTSYEANPTKQTASASSQSSTSNNQWNRYAQKYNAYHDSGKPSYQTSRSLYDEAVRNAQSATNAQDKQRWLDAANNAKNLYNYDNRMAYGDISNQIANLQNTEKELKRNQANANRAAFISMAQSTSNAEAQANYNDLSRQLKENQSEQARLQGILKELDTGIESANMTDDVQAAIQRLTDNKYTGRNRIQTAEANQKAQDQKTVDDFYASLGMGSKYYNLEDRILGTVEAAGSTIGSGFTNAAAYISRLGDYGTGVQNVEGWENAGWATDELSAANMNVGQYEKNRAEYTKKWEETGGNNSIFDFAADRLEVISDDLAKNADKELQQAKADLGKVGQFMVDAGHTVMTIGADMAVGAATGGASLVPMFARVFGETAGEARRSGASFSKQGAYGLAKASIETVTEKMFGAFDKIGYGKGFLPVGGIEDAITRMAKSDVGKYLIKGLYQSAEEGAEEVFSDLAAPFAQWIIDEQSRGHYFSEIEVSELFRDFLLGSALGGLGSIAGSGQTINSIRQGNQVMLAEASRAQAQGLELTPEQQMRLERGNEYGGLSLKDAGDLRRGMTKAEAKQQKADAKQARKEAKQERREARADNLRANFEAQAGNIAPAVEEQAQPGKHEGPPAEQQGKHEAPEYQGRHGGEFAKENGEVAEGKHAAEEQEVEPKHLSEEQREGGKHTAEAVKAEQKARAKYQGQHARIGEMKAETAEAEASEESAESEAQTSANAPKAGLKYEDTSKGRKEAKQARKAEAEAARHAVTADGENAIQARNNMQEARRKDPYSRTREAMRKVSKGESLSSEDKLTKAEARNAVANGWITDAQAAKITMTDAEARAYGFKTGKAAEDERVAANRKLLKLRQMVARGQELSAQDKLSWKEWGYAKEAGLVGLEANTFVRTKAEEAEVKAQAETAESEAKPAERPGKQKPAKRDRKGKHGDNVINRSAELGYNVAQEDETEEKAPEKETPPERPQEPVQEQADNGDIDTAPEATEEVKPSRKDARDMTSDEMRSKIENDTFSDDDFLQVLDSTKAREEFAKAIGIEKSDADTVASAWLLWRQGKNELAKREQAEAKENELTMLHSRGGISDETYAKQMVANDFWSQNQADDFLKSRNGEVKQETSTKKEARKETEDELNWLYRSGGISRAEYVQRMVANGYRDQAWAEQNGSKTSAPEQKKPAQPNPPKKVANSHAAAQEKADRREGNPDLAYPLTKEQLWRVQEASPKKPLIFEPEGNFKYIYDGTALKKVPKNGGKTIRTITDRIAIDELLGSFFAEAGNNPATKQQKRQTKGKKDHVPYDQMTKEQKEKYHRVHEHKSINPDFDNKLLSTIAKDATKILLKDNPVQTVNRNLFWNPNNKYEIIAKQVLDWLTGKTKGSVYCKALGENILIKKDGIDSDIAHGVGKEKAATFECLPEVLSKGKIISLSDGTVKNAGYIIGAKILLNGKPSCVYAIARLQGENNRLYLHEVADENGVLYYLIKDGQKNTSDAFISASGNNAPTGASEVSDNIIADDEQKVNNGDIAQPSTVKKDVSSKLKGQAYTKDAGKNMEDGKEFQWGKYDSATMEEVSRIADHRIDKAGMDAERSRLLDSDNWDRTDYAEAQKLIIDFSMKLNKKMVNGQIKTDTEYQTERYYIDELMEKYRQMKSEMGQKLQQKYKVSIADEIRMRAAHRFLNYSPHGDGRVFQGNRYSGIYRTIDNLLKAADKAVASNDVNNMIKVVEDASYIRGNQAMFGKLGVAGEHAGLEFLRDNGATAEDLSNLLYGDINRMIDDFDTVRPLNMVNNFRTLNMLSALRTANNNLLNNAAGMRIGAIAQNIGYLAAKQFEVATGKKVAIKDSSLTRLKNGTVNAEAVAFVNAALMSYYGINVENGRLELDNVAKFNPNGNFFERLGSRYSFLVSTFVMNPDQMGKARIDKGLQDGIEQAFQGVTMTPEMKANKAELEGYKEYEKNRRLVQADNSTVRLVQHFKEYLNRARIGNQDIGYLKLGDFLMPFAKVPVNIVQQRIAATPYGAMYHLLSAAKGYHEATEMHKAVLNGVEGAKEMSAKDMAKYSMNVGRAATTGGMLAIGAIAAMTGALKDFGNDDDDDDEAKIWRNRGFDGLTLNISAMLEMRDEWKQDDWVVGAGFLEIFAAPLAIGALAWDAHAEGMSVPEATWYATKRSFTDVLDAIADIPGMQAASQMYEAYTYAPAGEDNLSKAWTAVRQYLANAASGYVMPNALTQTATGLDNIMRNPYTADNDWQQSWQIFANKIPFLRNTLPAKLDMWGNPKKYAENKFLAFMNKAVLPGAIHQVKTDKYEDEIIRLSRAGYKNMLPVTSPPNKIEVGENSYQLNKDQKLAYEAAYKERYREYRDSFMDSELYQSLGDGQRVGVLKQLKLDAGRKTKQEFLDATNAPDSITMDKWETELEFEDQLDFLSAKQIAAGLWDNDENMVADSAKMDEFIKTRYGDYSEDVKNLLNNSYSHLDDLYDASRVGINSERWQTAYNIYKKWTDSKAKANISNEAEMWSQIEKAINASDAEMRFIEQHMQLHFQGTPDTDQYYEYLNDAGLTRSEASAALKAVSDLQPQAGYSSVQQTQKYMVICDTVPASKQWAAFWSIVPSNASKSKIEKMRQAQESGVDLKTALRNAGMSEIKGRELQANGKYRYWTISK